MSHVSMENTLHELLFGRNCGYERMCCVSEIARVKSPISYNEFIVKYMIPNIPCILESWITKEWPSITEWVKDGNIINTTFLNKKFGLLKVPVTECKNSYESNDCTHMLFSDFTAYISMKDGESNDQTKCLYLKDWHCYKENIGYKFYDIPIYFQSDWLNEYWENKNDDYRFVYFGPRGSWSPRHADVFRSYSWSANVFGRKKWIINSFCHDFAARSCDCPSTYEVVQERGELIFVPSGWFHEVHNLEVTISINHNWINAFNIDLCWKYLKDQWISVNKEIFEWREEKDFEELCQRILGADTGMNFWDFYNFIHFIAMKRVTFLQTCIGVTSLPPLDHDVYCKIQCCCKNVLDQYEFKKDETLLHLFDLRKIIRVLYDFVELFIGGLEDALHDDCACHPSTLLNLLEAFNSTVSIQIENRTKRESSLRECFNK